LSPRSVQVNYFELKQKILAEFCFRSWACPRCWRRTRAWSLCNSYLAGFCLSWCSVTLTLSDASIFLVESDAFVILSRVTLLCLFCWKWRFSRFVKSDAKFVLSRVTLLCLSCWKWCLSVSSALNDGCLSVVRPSLVALHEATLKVCLDDIPRFFTLVALHSLAHGFGNKYSGDLESAPQERHRCRAHQHFLWRIFSILRTLPTIIKMTDEFRSELPNSAVLKLGDATLGSPKYTRILIFFTLDSL
jgi:hypothetical protein